MKGVTDFLTKIYDRFLLLDLLSYVCPGLILIISALGLRYLNSLIQYKLDFLIGLLGFLFSFIIGLAVNEIGKLLVPDIYCKKEQNICNRINDKKENRELFYERMVAFLQCQNTNLLSKRERYIILKQMTRNNAVAIVLGVLIYLARNNFRTSILFLLIMSLIVALFLFIASCLILRNQKDFEETVIKKIMQ